MKHFTGALDFTKNLFDFAGPAVRIRQAAPLNAGQVVVQLLRNLTDFKIVDDVLFALVVDFADGRDDSGGAAAKGLL